MGSRKGLPLILIISGMAVAVAGGILCWIGSSINGDYGRQIESFFNTGRHDDTGDMLQGAGIFVLCVGGLLFVVGICLYIFSASYTGNGGQAINNQPVNYQSFNNQPLGYRPPAAPTAPPPQRTAVNDYAKPVPPKRFSGKYAGLSGVYSVEFNPNGTLILNKNGDLFKGIYRPTNTVNEFEIVLEGFGSVFRFNPVNKGIYVYGGPVSEVFEKE